MILWALPTGFEPVLVDVVGPARAPAPPSPPGFMNLTSTRWPMRKGAPSAETTTSTRARQVLIERYGGATGIRDAGALESALHRPQTGYYDTIVHEAAALLEVSFKTIHPSTATNAWPSLWSMSSCESTVTRSRRTQKAIYDLPARVPQHGTFDLEHLAPWLQGNNLRACVHAVPRSRCALSQDRHDNHRAMSRPGDTARLLDSPYRPSRKIQRPA